MSAQRHEDGTRCHYRINNWLICQSYRARIHPPGFQSRPDSHSTSWKSLWGRSDDAGKPVKQNLKVWPDPWSKTDLPSVTWGQIKHEKDVPSTTHNPSSFVGGHVAVHLHALAGVSVDVNGVDAAQRLSIQQVLSAILRRRKQSTPWRKAKEARGLELCSTIDFTFKLHLRQLISTLL